LILDDYLGPDNGGIRGIAHRADKDSAIGLSHGAGGYESEKQSQSTEASNTLEAMHCKAPFAELI
jgi:hypothetical protein